MRGVHADGLPHATALYPGNMKPLALFIASSTCYRFERNGAGTTMFFPSYINIATWHAAAATVCYGLRAFWH